jgi:hypothetical protein
MTSSQYKNSYRVHVSSLKYRVSANASNSGTVTGRSASNFKGSIFEEAAWNKGKFSYHREENTIQK